MNAIACTIASAILFFLALGTPNAWPLMWIFTRDRTLIAHGRHAQLSSLKNPIILRPPMTKRTTISAA